ncbi:hypothetical protein BASA81_006764 [Batrachochytrium salamandrivorans]|nr:hypothetical protein BASA81_006764 [Batrachochytrium salamandrivorans]
MLGYFSSSPQTVGLDAEAQTSAASTTSGSFRLPSVLTGKPEEEDDLAGQLCQSLQMSYSTRIKGFAICFLLGALMSITSTFVILNPVKFAISYSIGNVLSLASTGFLVGPMRQMRMACDPIRRVAFVIFVLSFIATLVSAFAIKKSLVTLVFVIVQVLAGAWYTVSYIPYGRQMLSSCITRIIGKATIEVQG